VIAPNNESRR